MNGPADSIPWTKACMPVSAGLIALGLLPMPGDLLIVQDWQRLGAAGATFLGIITAVQMAALMPMAVILLDVVAGWRLPSLAAKVLGWTVLPLGFLATFVSLIDAGGGSEIILAKGVLLTFAVSGALFWTARGRMGMPGRILSGMMVAPAIIAAVASLVTVPVVLISARSLADGAPHCLALHKTGAAPIENYLRLRLFSFHTTLAGYKDNQVWYFHGLLVVDAGSGERIFNWSPRRMGFEEVRRPGTLAANPRGACTPTDDRGGDPATEEEGP